MSVSYGDLKTVPFKRDTCRGHLFGRDCYRSVEREFEVLAASINPQRCERVRCSECGTINPCHPAGQPNGVIFVDE